MKLFKQIIAIAIALIAAYFAIKIIFGLLSFAVGVIAMLLKIAVIAIIALPIFFFVKKKFLNSSNDRFLP